MANFRKGGVVPATVPGESLTRADMARVTEDDWADIRKGARTYCASVDATRSRKRMDGSATVARGGHALYGSDDVSDDTTQDAVLLYATYLRRMVENGQVAAQSVETRQAAIWVYERKSDGEPMMVSRTTLQRWAIRDAAKRNGYRVDVPPTEEDATPGAQTMRGVRHAEHVATASLFASLVSEVNEAAWRMTWDAEEFPTLARALFHASEVDNLGRNGVLTTVAQALHGGVRGSRRIVARTRDAAAGEWGVLSARLDETRGKLMS